MRLILLLLLLVISCGPQKVRAERDIEGPFYKPDGSCYSNIAHRVGGDFLGLRDNNLFSAKRIKHLERHPCFRHWEFDVTSSRKSVIVFHDRKIDGKRTRFIPSYKIRAHKLRDFIPGMLRLSPEKSLMFDIKDLRRRDWALVIGYAEKSSIYATPLFSTSRKRRKKYKELINIVRAKGWEFRFYGKK